MISSAVKAGQPGSRGGACAPAAGRAPRRDAGRADAPQMGDRDRRHARQDDDDLDDREPARNRRARPDRDQRRHHQRLWHEYAARGRRLDGRRSRRKRRHVHAIAGDRRDRHQHRPRASRFLWRCRGVAPGFREFRLQYPVLRLRGSVHRSSGRAGPDPARLGPPHRDLRVRRAGRLPRRQCQARRPTAAGSTR